MLSAHDHAPYALKDNTRTASVQGFFLYSLLFFLSRLLLSGCEEPPQTLAVTFDRPLYRWGSVRNRTITIRGSQNDLGRPYVLKAIERYQEFTGNTIRLQMFTHQELSRSLLTAFHGDIAEQPDILHGLGGTSLGRIDPESHFYDFTGATWVDDLTDTAINQTIWNGKVIGFPYGESSVSGMLYNKNLFKKYGLTIPRTQKEFLDVCEKLLKNGITPVYLPYSERTMLLYQFPMDSILSDTQTLEALNNRELSYAQIPEMHKIVSWYRTMSDLGYFGKDYLKNGWDGMDTAMRSEKYAMMICWDTWLYTNFTGDPSHFGLMPAFMGVPEQGVFEGPNLMLLTVNKNSLQLDAALDFIQFMADPFNYNISLSGMYTTPIFKNQAGTMATPQYMEAERLIEKQLYDSMAWPRVWGFSQLDAVYVQKHMQDKDYSVEDCLKDMDAARIRRAGNRD